nr:amidohydrolase family protein [Eggerthella sinensis]
MKTIFHNAMFHTMESEDDVRTSLTVEDGVIAGFDETPAACPSAQAVDLGGLHVFPALIDAHLHLLDTIALSSMGEAVCEIVHGRVEPHDLAGAERKIRALATDAKPGSLLICSNFIAAAMDEGRLPTRFELDAWARSAQVWVINIDGHSGSCSSSLLEALGLEDIAPDGVFSGPAHDANLGAFTDHLASSITPRRLHAASRTCATSAPRSASAPCARSRAPTTASATAWPSSRRSSRSASPSTCGCFPQYMDEKKLEAVRGRMGAARVGGCMKWELDGSVGSRTAAFASPYLDGTQGALYFDDAELRRTVERFAARGFIVSAHAIGEAAIDQLVDIYDGVPGRHRIDHCEFPSDHAIERICATKPFVTVQPGYAWIDQRFLHGYERYLSADQIARQVPLARLAAAGVPSAARATRPCSRWTHFCRCAACASSPCRSSRSRLIRRSKRTPSTAVPCSASGRACCGRAGRPASSPASRTC